MQIQHLNVLSLDGGKNRTMLEFPFLEAENLIDIDYMDKEPFVE